MRLPIITVFLLLASFSVSAEEAPLYDVPPFTPVSEIPLTPSENADMASTSASPAEDEQASAFLAPSPVQLPPTSTNQVAAENAEPPIEDTALPETMAIPAPKPKKRPSALSGNRIQAAPHNSSSKGVTLRPRPGITDSAVIARGILNRIITPYANPKVYTVDSVETKIDGMSVYVATNSEEPVSLFISDAETGQATPLQLIPKNFTAPVEIRIEADGHPTNYDSTANTGSGAENLFRGNSDYLAEIKTIMQALAKQLVPSGFELEESAVPNDFSNDFSSLCHSPYLNFETGQTLSGQDTQIVVLVATNNSLVTRMIEEGLCSNERVIAVAAWPRIRLNAREKTEVYVLMRKDIESQDEIRPSLL